MISKIKHLSLKSKITGIVLFVIILLSVGSFINMQSFSKSYKLSLGESREADAVVLGDRIGSQFYERYGDVQAFAINPIVQNLDTSHLQELLDQYTTLYGIYDLIIVVDIQGRFIASNSKDVAGKFVNTQALRDVNYTELPWYKAIVQKQLTEDKSKGFAGTFFEDFVKDSLMKSAFGIDAFTSGFTTPIKDKKGNVIGIISNRAGKRWFENEVASVVENLVRQGQKDVEVTVTNKLGQIISFGLWNDSAKTVELITDTERILKENFANKHKPAGQFALERKTGYIDSKYEDEDDIDLVGYHYLNNRKWIDSFGWMAFVHTKHQYAYKPVYMAEKNFDQVLIICSFLCIALAISLGIITSKSVNQIIEVLTKNSSNLLTTSDLIAESSLQLSESAVKQASALQETAAAIDEISAMVGKNAESTNRSRAVSQQSKEVAEKGLQVIKNMISSIEDIDDSNDKISKQMDSSNIELSEITKLISDIATKTKVINEIVFQTKLLSFNASVEAARAGETGKGFAVVAEEVGNLAQMSGSAAEEISSMLDASIKKVDQIVNGTKLRVSQLIDISKEKVQQGTVNAKNCSRVLDEIIVNVQRVDALVAEIAVASNEQASGVREISKAIGEMEQSTQKNASVSSDTSVVAEQLKSQSLNMRTVVVNLAFLIRGKTNDKNLSLDLKGSDYREGKYV